MPVPAGVEGRRPGAERAGGAPRMPPPVSRAGRAGSSGFHLNLAQTGKDKPSVAGGLLREGVTRRGAAAALDCSNPPPPRNNSRCLRCRRRARCFRSRKAQGAAAGSEQKAPPSPAGALGCSWKECGAQPAASSLARVRGVCAWCVCAWCLCVRCVCARFWSGGSPKVREMLRARRWPLSPRLCVYLK